MPHVSGTENENAENGIEMMRPHKVVRHASGWATNLLSGDGPGRAKELPGAVVLCAPCRAALAPARKTEILGTQLDSIACQESQWRRYSSSTAMLSCSRKLSRKCCGLCSASHCSISSEVRG